MSQRIRPVPPRPRSAQQPALLADFARACGLAGPLRVLVRDDDGRPAGEHLIRGPFAFVGRGRRADVPLDAPEVSPQHAFVLAVGGRAFVLDLGSRTGVRWPDGPQAYGWVGPDEDVQIGPYSLRVQCESEDGEAPPAGPQLTALELLNEPPATKVRPLPDAVTLVGRASACAFRGYGPKLAAHHCALVKAGGCLWVADLRSGRGTRVNGRPVRVARLRDGDLIEAGEWTAVPRPSAETTDALAEVRPAPQTGAGAHPFAPFGQMMDQFQQCVMMMGQMFRAMQQEHLSLVRDQVVQLRDVARTLLDHQAEAPLAVPFADSIPDALPAPPEAPPIAPTLPDAADTQALLQAHAWFNQRLAHLSGTGTP
jgi:pSer/pThr/pTyr-binding forkhead associated (FHA) protein